MKVKDLIKLLQDGCDNQTFSPETRIMFRENPFNPINLERLDIEKVLYANDDDGTLGLPPTHADEILMLVKIAEDEGVFLQQIKDQVETCVILRPKSDY